MELDKIERKDRDQVEVYFSCRNLVIKDLTSKSDPYLVVYMRTANKNWAVVGKTEIKWNNLDPDFAKSFTLDFIFERHQWIRVECRDADDPTGTQYDCLGEVNLG